MVKFYKDGDRMGIKTDCVSKDDFFYDAASELSDIIESGAFENDWEFQLERWLPQIYRIANSYEISTDLVIEETIKTTGWVDKNDEINYGPNA